VDINEVLSERIQQLEQVVQQYKERNEQLLTEINQMGEDSNTIGEGRSRKTLAADIETEKAQQAELASCMFILLYLMFHWLIDSQSLDRKPGRV